MSQWLSVALMRSCRSIVICAALTILLRTPATTQSNNPRANNHQSTRPGSRTITIDGEDLNRQDPASSSDRSPATLILRARPILPSQRRQPRVQWQENVIDNEGLGRKKSKVCCIYNKPKAFDESSDESDHSDSDCCRSPSSSSRPCPPTSSSPSTTIEASNQVTRPYTLPTPPRSPNAYEAEPRKLKGKDKA